MAYIINVSQLDVIHRKDKNMKLIKQVAKMVESEPVPDLEVDITAKKAAA